MSHASFFPPYRLIHSPATIARFPFPFSTDRYDVTVNLEPIAPGPAGSVTEHPIDLDEHYLAEAAEKARVLGRDPGRALEPAEHTDACWEACRFLMQTLAQSYPDRFALIDHGQTAQWINRPLGIDQSFDWHETNSLMHGPLEFMARQIQGDLTLQGQRDDQLWLDAGVLTGPADWSLRFNAGMNFQQWHAPVPERIHDDGVFRRAERFLLGLRPDQPMRRFNWSMTVNPRLDTSPETWDEWGNDLHGVTPQNVAERVHLRVELQSLWRLPRSHSILFHIRTYLMPLHDLASRPDWTWRLHAVLSTLPENMANYKGITVYRAMVLDWLARQ